MVWVLGPVLGLMLTAPGALGGLDGGPAVDADTPGPAYYGSVPVSVIDVDDPTTSRDMGGRVTVRFEHTGDIGDRALFDLTYVLTVQDGSVFADTCHLFESRSGTLRTISCEGTYSHTEIERFSRDPTSTESGTLCFAAIVGPELNPIHETNPGRWDRWRAFQPTVCLTGPL
ncbi:MAG: hypothetical protein ACT4PT_01270 [Methanobacteriota archaeon]